MPTSSLLGDPSAAATRMPAMTARRLALALLAAALLAPAPALAAPPPNDQRASATAIASLPSTQNGTTAEATREVAEPRSPCGCDGGSLWYRYVAAAGGRPAVTPAAAGGPGATPDASLPQRSQVTAQDSAVTHATRQSPAAF